MHSTLLLQITQDTLSNQQGGNGQGEAELTMIELLIKGGWIMLPLLILAVVAVYIFIERYLTIQRASRIDRNFMNKIRDMVVNDNIEGAKQLCKNHDTPVARMVEKGISGIGRPLKDISASIENAGTLEVFKLEKNTATLGTISGAAPMIGFLGTVTGMIKAFYQLSVAGNNIDPSMLAGGIYEAMVTTATGLAIGIIAYIGYNYLATQIEKIVYKMEATTVEFIDILQEPAE
jgi:biopolymer transport protein ExbB